MPLNVKTISINIAVICFFGLCVVALLSGLSPYICCKRAIIGAVIVYISANFTVRLINIILFDAMITQHIEQENNSELAKNNKIDKR